MTGRPYVTRFTFGIVGTALVLGVLLVVLYQSYTTYDRNNALTLHTEEVQGALQSMRADLYRAESLIRAFYLSGRTEYLVRSRETTHAAARRLEQIRQLTEDNEGQQTRVVLLREAIERSMQTRDGLVALLAHEGIEAVQAEYRGGAPGLGEVEALISAMANEERRLFTERKARSDASATRVMAGASVLLALGVLGLALLAYRLLAELRRRVDDDVLLKVVARDATTHVKALDLFNAERDRSTLLRGMLAILAEELSMPVSAFFAHDSFGDELVLEVAHGLPPDHPRTYVIGEGVVGAVARTRKASLLPTGGSLTIDTGLGPVTPGAVLACAVSTQERVWGVLVVASTEAVADARIEPVERLCAQLAIALENLDRMERLRQLGEQLRARSEEIARKNAELEHANHLKSEFLATMSHELRTPLNAIIGFSESLRDEIVGPLSTEQKEFVGIVFDSGQHLLSLINDVLDLSKIEAGHMELEPEPIEVTSLVSNSLSVVKERAMRAHVALESHVDPSVEALFGDARKIKQIIYNLLSNAVKYTPEGGQVRFEVAPAKAHDLGAMTFTAPLSRPADEYVELRVTDTGIGIDDADKPRLFRPFVQLEGALTRRHGGTGLGLALVDRLVALHDGRVGFASTKGAGSRFSVFLPRLRKPSVSARRPEMLTPSQPLARPRVALVVEDDANARTLIREQLESARITAVLAETAERALALARTSPPDIIILDLLLPGMDGFTFLDTVHKDPVLARVPVVITSVIADQNRGISLGAFRVLQKPVSREVLLEAVEAIAGAPHEARTVLVVDDDPQAVKLVAQQLEPHFAEVIRAYGGEEAIAVAVDRLPDVIVLDLMMPDTSGFEVVETLKARPATSQIPIAILTSKVLTAAERAKLSTHVEVIMQKSEFNHGRFLNEVRRALSSAHVST